MAEEIKTNPGNYAEGITAHCVVRNEERWIWFSIKSVIDYVKYIFVYDTGSKDKTIEIIQELKNKYPDKIIFKKFNDVKDEDFYKLRQEQVDQTRTKWFMVLDGDEIWYKAGIRELIEITESTDCKMVATRFYNCVGDIYHLKSYDSEHYYIKGNRGSITIRAYSKDIKGIKCLNGYGVEGYFDSDNKPVQENTDKIEIQSEYFLHMSYTARSGIFRTMEIPYRRKKIFMKWDYKAPKDFTYPEVFYVDRPGNIFNPFNKMSTGRIFVHYLLRLRNYFSGK